MILTVRSNQPSVWCVYHSLDKCESYPFVYMVCSNLYSIFLLSQLYHSISCVHTFDNHFESLVLSSSVARHGVIALSLNTKDVAFPLRWHAFVYEMVRMYIFHAVEFDSVIVWWKIISNCMTFRLNRKIISLFKKKLSFHSLSIPNWIHWRIWDLKVAVVHTNAALQIVFHYYR